MLVGQNPRAACSAQATELGAAAIAWPTRPWVGPWGAATKRTLSAAPALNACAAQHMVRPTAMLCWLTSDEEITESLWGLQHIHMARWSALAHLRWRGRRREVAHQ
jgi:hypothetical protein